MIKIKVTEKNGLIGFSYKQRKTNSLEHLFVIANMYNYIKDNTDMLDEEIANEVKNILEKIKEEK